MDGLGDAWGALLCECAVGVHFFLRSHQAFPRSGNTPVPPIPLLLYHTEDILTSMSLPPLLVTLVPYRH